jgi:hypothetical protein
VSGNVRAGLAGGVAALYPAFADPVLAPAADPAAVRLRLTAAAPAAGCRRPACEDDDRPASTAWHD